MHACSMKARQNNGMLSQLISSSACGRSELTQKLFPLPPNTCFSMVGSSKLKGQVFLKKRSKNCRTFQSLLQEGAGRQKDLPGAL